MMKTIRGVAVPPLGLGTYELAGKAGEAAILSGIEIGYRHIDTASRYGNEGAVGRAIRASGVPRGDLFVTTKVWMSDLRPDDVRRSVSDSLARLQLDHVDLLLVHWPNPDIPLGETLDAFAEQKAKGRTRLIGVSNFTLPLLDEALNVHGADLFCNQVEYHPFLSQARLLERMGAADMLLMAYQPIARGAVNDTPLLQRIGARYGKTPVQVTLRWLIQQPRVGAIPRSSNPGRQAENFDIFDFTLTGEEMAAIHGLAEGRRTSDYAFAPQWDED